MTEHTYEAAQIKVLEFDASIRKRPSMYFGVGQGDPALPASVLCTVAVHALHPATGVAREHTLRTVIEITDSLSFTMTMDQPHSWEASGAPALGYYDSLLGPEWWLPAAAAALCERAAVEMWCAGRGFRQDLAGIRPLTAPQEFEPPAGSGTKVTFALDPEYVGAASALPTDLEHLDLHGPHCSAAAGPGHVTIRDLRDGGTAREALYR
ncbi:hypothetical protein [Streptomyces sp. NPDC059389]|uniref:hypothetical protein n=1 Tax=Streptomyces sp. NPDC059389 TaxID=3346818 RepID=UPI0036BFDB8A